MIERTHCKNGHPWTPENLSSTLSRKGIATQRCKLCKKETDIRFEERSDYLIVPLHPLGLRRLRLHHAHEVLDYDLNYMRDPVTNCKLWKRAKRGDNAEGYGVITLDGTQYGVHVLSAILANLPKPLSKSLVLHHCDTPSCYEPEHLYWGDTQDNSNDKVVRKRIQGERNPRSKLNEKSVAEIRARCNAGERQKDIAVEYGVTAPLISQIVLNKIWRIDG